ncbi:MAG: hypothetical protein ABJG47_16900 [Ekhidna sp.]
MNKTQILIALVILSIFGVSATYLDLSQLISSKSEKPATERKVKHGEVRQYTKSKKLRTVVNYDQGIKHGTSYLYHDDGETILLAMPYNKGKREGTSMKYFESGVLYASTSYQNDRMHGPRKIHYSSGQLKAIINYGYGNPGTGTKEYLLDGTLKNENRILAKKNGNIYLLSTSEECKKSKFFIGKLIDDRYFNAVHKDVRLLPKDNGTYFVDLNVYTTSYLKLQDIICECESKQGNPIILKTNLNP